MSGKLDASLYLHTRPHRSKAMYVTPHVQHSLGYLSTDGATTIQLPGTFVLLLRIRDGLNILSTYMVSGAELSCLESVCCYNVEELFSMLYHEHLYTAHVEVQQLSNR